MAKPKLLKPVKKKVEKENVSFHMLLKDKKKLVRILRKHGLTQSGLIRKLVLDFIEDATEAAAKGAVHGVIDGLKGDLK